MRELNKSLSLLAKTLSVSFAAIYLYTSGFGIFNSQTNLGLYLLFCHALAILLYPASKKSPGNKALIAYDVAVFVLSAAAIIYWMAQYSEYCAQRVGLPDRWDVYFGLAMIFVCLEVTRRTMGNTLAILGLVMLLQTYFGPYLPGIFTHRGISIARIVEFNYFIDGIFGTVVSVFATYVMPFLIFGAFLQKSGGGDFFIDLASALAGRIAGGPALIAIGGSAIFGSISGSPVANVSATGTFTIPMMKRVGYSPEFAGAVEAAASTGGTFLPPIMGAGAFILATITETPYSKIMIMAALPALLYYASLVFMVYFRARKKDLQGLSKEELPRLSEVFKKGWYFALTIVVLIILIMAGFSVPVTAFGATLFVSGCSMLRKETRLTPRKLIDILETAGKSALSVGAIAGTLGLVMGGITLSGLGIKFSAAILAFSHGNLFLTVILVALIATIVGMGLPCTASYIILAILAAQSLIQLGILPVHAHLLIFWLSMISNLTPPVCVAAFAAASISGGSPMKTGLHAFILGIYMYLMPFAFAYTPQIFILGSRAVSVLEIVLSFSIGTVALAAAVQGWLFRKLSPWERGLYFAACILLSTPELITDVIGAVLFIVLTFLNYQAKKRSLALLPAPAK
jgi:TRAP transporter 4TM/12TM fusion protein